MTSIGGPRFERVRGLETDSSTGASAPTALESKVLSGDPTLSKVFDGSKLLRRGSHGPALRRVQQSLEAIGLPLRKYGADGRWHNEMRDRLVELQLANGQEGSGVVDRETLLLLDRLLAASDTALAKAALDGTIGLRELKAAEGKIAAKYGEAEAPRILMAAVGQNADKLTFQAVDYLQGKIGSMDGHIDRYQQVLQGHLKGAKVLDSNFNGRLDGDDLVFQRAAGGKTQAKKIGDALADRVRIGGAMVNAAYEMGKAEHDFGDLKFNVGAWEIEDEDAEDGMGVMVLAPGVNPADAVRDITNNPKLYRFECATALTVIRYKAMLEVLGDKDFNRVFKDIRIGPWEATEKAQQVWKIEGAAGRGEEVAATDAQKAQVKPGEYSYFRNWDVSKAAYEGGWQGENVLSLGDGMYYGHPFGVIAGEDIVQYLNENRKEGSTRSASLLDLRARIDTSILDEDRDPYH